VLAVAVVAAVALAFGLATATGADSRGGDGGSVAVPGGIGGGLGGDLEGPGGLDPDALDPDALDPGAVDGGLTGGADGGTTGDVGDIGGDTGGSGSGGDIADPTPTQPADPTLEAYQAVSAGDCLNTWMINETDWVSDVPEVVSCEDDGAGVWVSQVSEWSSDCPLDAGRSYLSYTSGLESVALCVTRQFEVGQCFLGMEDGSANLMSWVDCEGGEIPAPYSLKYNVTGVWQAPSNPTGDECRESASDPTEYWWWTVDGESVLLCTVKYTG
jgi:hypothetical protein